MSDDHTERKGLFDVWLRVIAAIVLLVLLVLEFRQIASFGDAAIYAASWVTFLHLCIGEYVLVRHLHVRSPTQNLIDGIAFVFLAAAFISFSSTALWCAFFAGIFALAIIKYMLVRRTTANEHTRAYAREKLWWESPAVILLTVTAVTLQQLPPQSRAVLILEICLLTATSGFAVWMIGFRHVYRQLIQNRRAASAATG